jgi:hypothetical protein
MTEHIIDQVKIPFDENWSRIAVSLSGGADSALLLYLLCQLAKEHNPKLTIHVISHVRMWKTKPWQEFDSLRVYEYFAHKFNFLNWNRHINFIAPELEYGNTGPSLIDEYGKNVSGDNIQIRAYSEYICHKFKIQAYYNAVTRNPKGVDFTGMAERDVDQNENNTHLRLMKHMNGYAIHPFRFIEKTWIVAQYKRLQLMNLFNMTRSCEGEFKGIDYATYRYGDYVPTCGECFWCKERNWAIDNEL